MPVSLSEKKNYENSVLNFEHFFLSIDYELCHLFTNTIVTQPSCIHGLNVLATAINKIRTSESQLTPIHADLCQLSLKSKCFRVALKYLDVDITTILTSAETRGQSQTVLYFTILFVLRLETILINLS